MFIVKDLGIVVQSKLFMPIIRYRSKKSFIRLLKTLFSTIVWNFSAITVSKEYAVIRGLSISSIIVGYIIYTGLGVITSPKPMSKVSSFLTVSSRPTTVILTPGHLQEHQT